MALLQKALTVAVGLAAGCAGRVTAWTVSRLQMGLAQQLVDITIDEERAEDNELLDQAVKSRAVR